MWLILTFFTMHNSPAFNYQTFFHHFSPKEPAENLMLKREKENPSPPFNQKTRQPLNFPYFYRELFVRSLPIFQLLIAWRDQNNTVLDLQSHERERCQFRFTIYACTQCHMTIFKINQLHVCLFVFNRPSVLICFFFAYVQ